MSEEELILNCRLDVRYSVLFCMIHFVLFLKQLHSKCFPEECFWILAALYFNTIIFLSESLLVCFFSCVGRAPPSAIMPWGLFQHLDLKNVLSININILRMLYLKLVGKNKNIWYQEGENSLRTINRIFFLVVDS